MEEGQVTVDGTTYLLGRPFMVIATQNPAEMEGTYPLPEAQRDRFMARVHMGYPDRSSEIRMLQSHSADEPLESLAPVTDAAEVRDMIDARGRPVRLEIDGGVKPDNIGEIAKAGADTFVAGSAIFGKPDYVAVIAAMKQAVAAARAG